jgi:hypothetical protein
MGDNSRREGGTLDDSCKNEGGGGVLESVVRLLAYRDYAKEKIRANPRGFQLRFDEMVVKANEYAIILRGSRRLDGREIKRPDRYNVIRRATHAWRTDTWEGGRDIIKVVVQPNREAIALEIRNPTNRDPRMLQLARLEGIPLDAAEAAADVAAANPGIAGKVWNYFFDFWANPARREGGMRTRRRRTKHSSRKTRQRR